MTKEAGLSARCMQSSYCLFPFMALPGFLTLCFLLCSSDRLCDCSVAHPVLSQGKGGSRGVFLSGRRGGGSVWQSKDRNKAPSPQLLLSVGRPCG